MQGYDHLLCQRSHKIGSNFYWRPWTYPCLFDENPWRLYFRSRIKWKARIFHIVPEASKRLYIQRLLKSARVDHASLITVYTTCLRSAWTWIRLPNLELRSFPLSFNDVERIQKNNLTNDDNFTQFGATLSIFINS